MTKDPAESPSNSDVQIDPIMKIEIGQDSNNNICPNRVLDEIPLRIPDLSPENSYELQEKTKNLVERTENLESGIQQSGKFSDFVIRKPAEVEKFLEKTPPGVRRLCS